MTRMPAVWPRVRIVSATLGVVMSLGGIVAVAGCTVGSTSDSGGEIGLPTAGASPSAARPTQAAATPAAFDVQAENRRPGANCGLKRLGYDHAVEGWLSRVSLTPGQPVTLYASTTARQLTVSVFRIGWYGGHGCRLVTQRGPLPGVAQPAATRVHTNPGGGTVNTVSTIPSTGTGTGSASADATADATATATASADATATATATATSTADATGAAPGTASSWQPTTTLDTSTWPPGDYLFRLDDSDGFQSYVPLTVRGPDARGKIVVLNAVTTWQAYNAWGGYSLYHGLSGYADRARIVSFDRPYDYGDGAADFTGNEAPLVTLAEKLGLDLDYATDVDLHADPTLLDGARAVISLGHDEYYSVAMRRALETARDAGTNLAFLGANAVYRRIRLGPSPIGPDRLETAYKDPGEDPLDGVNNAQITANWPSPPMAEPESSLTGGMYQCNPVHADLIVRLPDHWLLRGTGAAAGTAMPGMIGSEYDRVDLAYPTPRDIEVLAHSPVTCHGRADHSDVSYYTATSGAGVFDAGTSAWICALNDVCGPGATGPGLRSFVTTVTTTMLRAFAFGPAGQAHPAARSVPPDDAYTSAGVPEP
ncbi:MAG: N,N-dimethylformamidase beta subunit family domain-containing protein [Frankia sp.]